MNPIDKIYQAIFEKTAIANHSGEKLVLMMEREPIRQKDLFASEVESMAETARISNVVFLDFQVADYRWLPVLDMAYEKSLEVVLLQYTNWQQKNPKEITLEQMCFPMMLDFAKDTFSGAKGRLPSGFWFHATELYPMDWKQDLDSGFSELDLVDSVVSQMKTYVKAYQKRERVVDVLLQYGKHVKRQNSYDDLLNKKNLFTETIEALKNAEKEMAEAENDLNGMYADGAALVVNGIIDILPDTDPTNILQAFAERLDFKKLLKEGMVSKFADAYKTSNASTDKYVNVSRKLVEKSRELIANKSSDYTYELKSSYEQLDIINEEIEDVKAKMKMVLAKESSGEGTAENLFPDSYEKRFMEVLIQTNTSELSEGSFESSEAASTSCGVNFLFGGVKIESGSSKSFSAEELVEAEMSISIVFWQQRFLSYEIALIRVCLCLVKICIVHLL